MQPHKVSLPKTIYVPIAGNDLLEKALTKINDDIEIKTLWKVVNINAIDRLGMSDHGPVHVQIIANIALRLTRILLKNGVVMSITRYYDLPDKYAELVVLLASLFHDLGMSISREGHEEFSLFLANNILHKILDFLPVEERTIVTSEVLHAIIAHRSGGKPYTLEAGIVRVADALDMSEGRSRIPYQSGNVDIYSISAAAIDKVEILEGDRAAGELATGDHPAGEVAGGEVVGGEIVTGEHKPIQINILMNNSAGLFQVDELLKRKLIGSGLEKYVRVRALIERRREKKLIKEFKIS